MLFDHIDLHVVLVTLISVPIVIMVPGGALVAVFLIGSFLVPQPMLWTRAYDRQRAGRAVRPYVLANEIAVLAIVLFAAYVKLQG